MEFRVLGRLEVVDSDQPSAVQTPLVATAMRDSSLLRSFAARVGAEAPGTVPAPRCMDGTLSRVGRRCCERRVKRDPATRKANAFT